ncbi:ABC transporter ATP-binding protein [Agromyces silvae]|uniref:ABC transporter ATP-binding protein n=1 Tax=Agromyces silvae TaxID=3388266 RepID=UPI00280B3B99|nr:ABC transporter ATP-binding protein [Agromyces protaetiae]
MTGSLLDVRELSVTFESSAGPVNAVNGVSFDVARGEAVAIVGESGSGKSVTALSILGLLPGGQRSSGEIRFDGRDLRTLGERDLQRVRGSQIALIPQDPMTSLNPVLSVGRQLGLAIRRHSRMTRAAARDRAAELLDLVGLPNASRRLSDYPHQFSGGQRQRILIALAVSSDPALLVADEPTTALDVTVQAQIIELVGRLREQLGTAVVWITHDLGVVAGMVDRVVVMYAGRVVESGPTAAVFADPGHPYTAGLLRSLPPHDGPRRPLVPITGSPPDLLHLSQGCSFAPRCPFAVDACRAAVPAAVELAPGHAAACIRTLERRAVVADQTGGTT